ncbi:MAG: MFS transporter [Hyphomonadaceae bacterium]|nr:MFS transporter [Hyphomonadaceae bacterium]
MSSASDRLPLPKVLAFASVGMPLAAVGLPMAVFVAPMYAEQLGLGTTMVGLIFMILRFWDLGTDPVMGWLVDTRPTKHGRIKHWLIASVPILMLGSFFMFMPMGETVSPAYLVVWLTVLWLGFTMLQTPHQSWVPMITTAYDERSRLFMWREIINTITLLTLLVVPTLLAINYGIERRGQVQVMGVILLIVLPLTVLLAVLFVPDPAPKSSEPKMEFSWTAIKTAFRDPNMVRVLLVEILVGIAIAGTGGTFLFAAQWGFGVTGLAPVILMVFFIAGFAAMPLWVRLSERTEKHTIFMVTCIWSIATYTLYLPLSAMGGGATYLLIAAVVSGLGYGTPFILARSMVADIIEAEQAKTGENRSGMYYSLMSGSYKTGASFAIGIPYILLGAWVGFDPSGENSPEVVRGLMYVFVGVPVASYALAAIILRKYRLTREEQKANADKLAAQAAE